MDKDNNNNSSNLNFYQDANNDLENNNMTSPYGDSNNNNMTSPYTDLNNNNMYQGQDSSDFYENQSNMNAFENQPNMDIYQNQEIQARNNTMQNGFDDIQYDVNNQNFYEPIDSTNSNIPEAPTEFTTYNAFDESANNFDMQSFEPIDNSNMQNSYEPMNNDMQNSYEPMDNMQNDYEPISNDSNTYNMNNNMYDDSNSDYNMDFVKTWMDKLYDKAHSKKFNWSAAFFGGIYFLYRKLYLTGILFILLSLLLTCMPLLLLNQNTYLALGLVPAFALILFFVYGFTFYPLYRSHVRKQLNNLKTSIANNGELINVANKKGHTSLVPVIIAVIITPIISGAIFTLTVGNQINALLSKLPKHPTNNTIDNSTLEPVTDVQTYTFLNQYTLEYDALSWFLSPSTNTLTKGNYSLVYSGQYLEDLQNSLGADPTSPSGRSALLNTLVTSLESQAASVNLTTEAGTSNFVMGTNAYYGYLDVISAENVSRYYFILLPENDILFQFILSTNDTSIDYTTNLEVINILTSIYEDDSYEQDNPTGGNTIDNSIIDNTTANDIVDGRNDTIANEVITNNIDTNDIASNEIDNNVSSNIVASNIIR